MAWKDRKAFVADGSATNWGVHRKHFSHYTAILDFTHAICYVYAAAMAGRSAAEGWGAYRHWAQWLWQGDIEALIAAVQLRSHQLGPPDDGDSETGPRSIVAETLRYIKNQRSRMQYAEYRRQGLPITSSHIESTIKQMNQRVKGSEKFWTEAGGESLLQLRADQLSDTAPLDVFWTRRASQATGTRKYRSRPRKVA